MANVTVTQLAALTSVATDDEIGVWDASVSQYKKATVANVVAPIVTGGGVVATGGYTLTVPATGTAALRNVATTYTALQTYSAGIAFANETLSVYDTGTWSPDLQFGGAKVGITYTAVAGRYVKIGALIIVFCQLTLSNKGSSTGNAIIEDSSGNLAGLGTPLVTSEGAVRWASMTNNFVNIMAENVGTSLYLLGLAAAGTGQSQLTHADFANNSTIRFVISWMV